MPEIVTSPQPLERVASMLGDLGGDRDDLTICIEAPLSIATPDASALVCALTDEELDADLEDWVPPGFVYLLEVDAAVEAASAITAPSHELDRARAAAVIYYATFDAWLPVGEDICPQGGRAEWGSSAAAASEANLQSVSEARARYPEREAFSADEQARTRVGDVVELAAWIAGPDGPRVERRQARVDFIQGASSLRPRSAPISLSSSGTITSLVEAAASRTDPSGKRRQERQPPGGPSGAGCAAADRSPPEIAADLAPPGPTHRSPAGTAAECHRWCQTSGASRAQAARARTTSHRAVPEFSSKARDPACP